MNLSSFFMAAGYVILPADTMYPTELSALRRWWRRRRLVELKLVINFYAEKMQMNRVLICHLEYFRRNIYLQIISFGFFCCFFLLLDSFTLPSELHRRQMEKLQGFENLFSADQKFNHQRECSTEGGRLRSWGGRGKDGRQLMKNFLLAGIYEY